MSSLHLFLPLFRKGKSFCFPYFSFAQSMFHCQALLTSSGQILPWVLIILCFWPCFVPLQDNFLSVVESLRRVPLEPVLPTTMTSGGISCAAWHVAPEPDIRSRAQTNLQSLTLAWVSAKCAHGPCLHGLSRHCQDFCYLCSLSNCFD